MLGSSNSSKFSSPHLCPFLFLPQGLSLWLDTGFSNGIIIQDVIGRAILFPKTMICCFSKLQKKPGDDDDQDDDHEHKVH